MPYLRELHLYTDQNISIGLENPDPDLSDSDQKDSTGTDGTDGTDPGCVSSNDKKESDEKNEESTEEIKESSNNKPEKPKDSDSSDHDRICLPSLQPYYAHHPCPPLDENKSKVAHAAEDNAAGKGIMGGEPEMSRFARMGNSSRIRFTKREDAIRKVQGG